MRPGFGRALLVAGRTPERLARVGANTTLVDRAAHGWARAIRMVECELTLIGMVGPPGLEPGTNRL